MDEKREDRRGRIAESELWWLAPSNQGEFRYVRLTHEPPVAQDDARDYGAFCYENVPVVLLREIDPYVTQWAGQNAYRSLQLWSSRDESGESIQGPCVIDVDNEEGDLEDAFVVVRAIVACALPAIGVDSTDTRVHFSGCKGFHVEVRPAVVEHVGLSGKDRWGYPLLNAGILGRLRKAKPRWGTPQSGRHTGRYGATILDTAHCFKRLHQSVNWWKENGSVTGRRVFELHMEELASSSVATVLARSRLG